MKVLLVNQYATDNLGDKLIGKVLKDILEQEYHCIVECKKFELFYPERTLLQGIEEKSKLKKERKVTYIKNVVIEKIECYSIRRNRIFYILKNNISLEEIDMVIIGGGELIKSNHIFILYLDVWTKLVKKMGKSKLILFGVSSDCNFTIKEKQQLRKILLRFDYINVRDKNSKKILAKISNLKIVYSPDIVFAYQKYNKLEYKKENKIQVSIFDYKSYDFSTIFSNIEEYFIFWYQIIVESAKGDLEKVEFFYTTPEDAICTKEFCQKYNKQFGKRIPKDFYYNEEQIIRKLAEADIVITGRMHAMIIALQYGAKIIPFEFKEKIRFFAKEWKEKRYSDETAWEVVDGVRKMFDQVKGMEQKEEEFNEGKK